MPEPFTYATVCSGIEAPSVAWEPLGWEPQFFSEIESFPKKVLKHHYPHVPNYGDMTKYKEWPDHEQLGLICGGTPCQAFSIAGLRKGLDDPRGNLSLVYIGLIAKYNPRWIIWENVPGVLSSNKGRDFGAFIRGLQEFGYHCCWRVLDAQYFGVPQRRRRVFLVGYLGDWRPPFSVLFEPESLRGNLKKGKAQGEKVASLTATGVGTCGPDDNQAQAGHLICAIRTAQTNSNGIGISIGKAHTLDGTQEQCISVNARQDPISIENKGLPLDTKGNTQAVAHTLRSNPRNNSDPIAEANMHIYQDSIVRRFSPVECERLQGFPDNYTLIPGIGRTIKKHNYEIIKYLITSFGFSESTAKRFAKHPDNVRYKALGNSMATPVVHWIGRRIKLYEEITDGCN